MAEKENYVKLNRDSKTDWLQENHPTSFLLLSLIARRARRYSGHIDGLQVGDAMIGDYEKAGLTRQQYRTALAKLVELNIVEIIYNGKKFLKREKSTIKTTIKGMLINLIDSSIYDINSEKNNQYTNQRPTNSQPTANHEQEAKKAKEANIAFSLKKESEKEKRTSLAFRSPSVKNAKYDQEDFQGIRVYCDIKNLPIDDKDIIQWLRKYPVERITSNLSWIIQKNEPFSIKLLVSALKYDYAGEPERILQNRNFAIGYKEKMGWSSLVITQQYCTCDDTGNSLKFNLHTKKFEQTLAKIYQTQSTNFG